MNKLITIFVTIIIVLIPKVLMADETRTIKLYANKESQYTLKLPSKIDTTKAIIIDSKGHFSSNQKLKLCIPNNVTLYDESLLETIILATNKSEITSQEISDDYSNSSQIIITSSNNQVSSDFPIMVYLEDNQ